MLSRASQRQRAGLLGGVLLAVVGPWLWSHLEFLGLYHAADCRLRRVFDGDTVQASCEGQTLKIRLYCLDAPERSQKPWGRESRIHLQGILPKTFVLKEKETDRYGRTVGEILDPDTGRNINLRMVEDGQAAVYHRYCRDSRYPRAEREAKAARRGIWRQPGRHQRPWDYRRGNGFRSRGSA